MSKHEQEQRAAELVLKGKKCLKFSILNLLKGDRYEQALQYFQKAANLYKMVKSYDKAAECFKAMVEPHKKVDSAYDAANDLQNASQMYEKVDGNEEEAISCLQGATLLYLDIGKFNRAAKCEEKLGDLLEDEEKFEEAINHYEKASTYFDNENLKTSALDCDKKIGHLFALLKQYDKSVEAFEKVAKQMANDKSLKWNAKEFFFKSLVVMFVRAGADIDEEIENIKENFEKYKDLDPHFDDSDYSELIEKMIQGVEEEDIKIVQRATKQYENKGKELDAWTTKMCLNIIDVMNSASENNL